MPVWAFLQDLGNGTLTLTCRPSATGGHRRLVSLIEGHEFDLLGVPELPAKVRSLGIIWIHLPIVDLEVPDWRFEEKWEKAGTKLSSILGNGGRIVLHCRAGSDGPALLLRGFGGVWNITREAIAEVRQARPGAIQTRNRRSMFGDAEGT